MEYPSNANMLQPSVNQQLKPPEHSDPAISNKAKTKPNVAKSMKGLIFTQDFRDIKEGVINDIIRPKIKEMAYNFVGNIVNSIDSTLQMMIFGDVRRSSTRPGDRVSYNQFSTSYRKPAPSLNPSISTSYNCDDLTYETRGDAEAVLMAMRDHLSRFNYVEVSRMYEFSNLSMPNWTSNNYGWDNLDGVTVKRTMEGDYVIDLPRAKPLPK